MSAEIGNEDFTGRDMVVMDGPEVGQKRKNSSGTTRRTLRMLTSHFLSEYGRGVGVEIHVDDAAEKLRTVRRRVYDIMAVFAEIGVVTKTGKSKYTWLGEKGAAKVLNGGTLKERASHQMKGKNPSSLGGLTRGIISHLASQPQESHELDQVAIAVLGLDAGAPNLKPKLRRAYDVASVLIALNVVNDSTSKVSQGNASHTKPKRCLVWRGVAGIQEAIQEAKDTDFTVVQDQEQYPPGPSGGSEYVPYMSRFFPVPFQQAGPPVFSTTRLNETTGEYEASMNQYMTEYYPGPPMSEFPPQQNYQGQGMMPGPVMFPIDIKTGNMLEASGQSYDPQQWMMHYFASLGKQPSDAQQQQNS